MNELKMGILPVYKEQDWTSFDAVAKLRGILKMKKLGHGGTLDPMATGVLPVFVGRAAKACDVIPDNKKGYRAGFKLGLSTDTEDITGEVLERCEKKVSLEDIEKIIPDFVGDIMQVPPMYSAVKINGKKLYEYARQGIEVERPAREIHVDGIQITRFDPESMEGEMVIDCRKGTYVRTVISDMGKRLGTFGVMTSLERTYSAGISAESCLKISEIESLAAEGKINDIIIPLDTAFGEYEKITLDEKCSALYKNGVRLYPRQVKAEVTDKIYRVYGSKGEFFGLGSFKGGLFAVKKNF